MSMFLHRSDAIDYQHVHEVRAALEIDMAGSAAERATPEDITQLRELTAELGAVGAATSRARRARRRLPSRRRAGDTQRALPVLLLEAIGPVLTRDPPARTRLGHGARRRGAGAP